MSGTPAIDTRSQNSFIKHKQSKKNQKAKQTKKQNKVAVRICRFFSIFFRFIFAFFRFIFAFVSPFPRRVQFLFFCFCCTFLGKNEQTRKTAKITRTNTKIKRKNVKNRQIRTATSFCFFAYYCVLFLLCYLLLFFIVFVFCFVFALLLLFCFFSTFLSKKLFDGWPCMAAIAQHNSI